MVPWRDEVPTVDEDGRAAGGSEREELGVAELLDAEFQAFVQGFIVQYPAQSLRRGRAARTASRVEHSQPRGFAWRGDPDS